MDNHTDSDFRTVLCIFLFINRTFLDNCMGPETSMIAATDRYEFVEEVNSSCNNVQELPTAARRFASNNSLSGAVESERDAS